MPRLYLTAAATAFLTNQLLAAPAAASPEGPIKPLPVGILDTRGTVGDRINI